MRVQQACRMCSSMGRAWWASLPQRWVWAARRLNVVVRGSKR
jgi:hypothetical protein